MQNHLERMGPLVLGMMQAEEKLAREGVSYNATAKPHPDSLNPTNETTKHTAANVPKDGLGARGLGGSK